MNALRQGHFQPVNVAPYRNSSLHQVTQHQVTQHQVTLHYVIQHQATEILE